MSLWSFVSVESGKLHVLVCKENQFSGLLPLGQAVLWHINAKVIPTSPIMFLTFSLIFTQNLFWPQNMSTDTRLISCQSFRKHLANNDTRPMYRPTVGWVMVEYRWNVDWVSPKYWSTFHLLLDQPLDWHTALIHILCDIRLTLNWYLTTIRPTVSQYISPIVLDTWLIQSLYWPMYRLTLPTVL